MLAEWSRRLETAVDMRKRASVSRGCLWQAVIRVAVSLFCAGISYVVWLAAFLLTVNLDSSVVESLLWLLAPVVTATGFATGILVSERLARIERAGFLHLWVWPFVGCVIGAGVVYWFGPMLIVFGMFAVGTASIALREVIVNTKSARTDSMP